ncbi:MAG: hypothetical protein KME30_15295 [Iphinoe sp. HA4291-MV1]|jgi:pyruvate dehydrogenase (quinone)/pyruvate oxidase|nr:hypothetical protein [Iphinoe sp. HA4291-MV1]
MGPVHVESIADLACRAALSYRGVAHINFPIDFQSQSAERKKLSMHNVRHHTSHVFAKSAQLPNEEDLERAAELLNTGKKVAILAGRGALAATDELEQVAQKLGAPIIKAMLGKAAVPDDSPYITLSFVVVGAIVLLLQPSIDFH